MESTRTPAPRVFVDSSVLISAVLSTTGSAHDLLRHSSEGMVVLVVSSLVLDEVERNVGRKNHEKLPRLRQLLDACPFEIAESSSELIASEAEQIEPKDAGIVAAAVAAGCRFLVTYDVKHLLAQAPHIEARHGIVVCTPAVVIASFGEPL